MTPSSTSVLHLLAAPDVSRLVDAACDLLPPGIDPVLIALERASGSNQSVRQFEDALRHLGRSVEVMAAPSSTADAWLRSRSTRWQAVDVSDRASRLTTVSIPAKLANASLVIAIVTISAADSPGDPIAIGLWARFAHPRQRLGARLSDPRDGLTAEIALAVKPALVLLFATFDDIPIVIATDDQIAAELAGLALRQWVCRPDADWMGPWEHPLVQRATELDLGVTTPLHIEPKARWLGDSDDPSRRTFLSLATALFARIGVDFKG